MRGEKRARTSNKISIIDIFVLLRCQGPATHARAFELLNLEAKCIQPAPTSTADKSNMILAVLGARGAGSGCARYSSGLRIRHLGRSKECK